jgi:UDP-glucose 4,6-dehydratase
MRLLVTGGCGFIGSAFCRRFRRDYASVPLVNFDLLYPCSTTSADLTTTDKSQNYVFVHGDIKDRALVDSVLQENAIDTIIHFAAQSHVDTSFTNPMLYTHDNVVGTHTLLEAARAAGITRFIHISTDEVYGQNNHGQGAFTEESLLKPTNPYAASKAAAEMFVHSYVHSFGFPAIIIRSNNVYGPGQYPEKVIPKFLYRLMANKPVQIQGSGNQLRSFLYTEDAAEAVLCVLFEGALGEIYNISSHDEISIKTLASKVLALVKPGEDVGKWIEHVEDRHFNDQRYWIESEPLRRLGWRQRVTLDEGLARTVEWYRVADRSAYWMEGGDLPPALWAGGPPPSPLAAQRCMEVDRKVALVWGHRGWIGGLFRRVLEQKGWTVIGAESRADSREAVREEMLRIRPTHVVSLIGRTHGPGFGTIDYLEQSGKLVENVKDNLYAPLTLASVAAELGLHMLYMGTGCIFEYDAAHPLPTFEADGTTPVRSHVAAFSESALPNFFGSSYSTVKGFTDRLMEELYGDTCLNVRIRMPISSEDNPRNFISKIIAYPKICSIPNSMTVLDDILPCLVDCMDKKVVGTLNATNPGVIDHHTILTWYKELQNPAHTWTEVTGEELVATLVKGARSNNYLDTTRIESLCPGLPTIHDSVRRLLERHRFAGRT